MFRTGTAIFLLFVVLWLGVYMDVSPHVESEPGFLLIPSSRYARAVSFGFEPLMADGIYLWSIQFYSFYAKQQRGRFLWHIFDVVTDLDPTYEDPYFLGALVMSLQFKDRRMAVRLMEKGIRNNPDEWMFPYEAGFFSKEAGDFQQAAKFFLQASEMPSSRPKIEHLYAAMLEEAGRLDEAQNAWQKIFDAAPDIWVKNSAARNLFDIEVKKDMRRLRPAIKAYRKRTGRTPPSLSELLRKGVLKNIPMDPYGVPYHYDSHTGEISSRSHFRMLKQ